VAYDAFYAATLGVMSPVFLYKLARGKYREGWSHKLGFVPEREAAPRIWIHAVSVGEAVAAGVLARALTEDLPGYELVASTITPTGQAVARRRFGDGSTFYLPLDFSGPVRRAVRRTKPGLLVLMELELWPNLVGTCARRGVPVVVANGRISDASFPKYRRFARLFRPTLRRISAVCCQTEEYADRFREIGAPPGRVFVTGSLKYDGVPTEPDPDAEAWARRELGVGPGERVLLGGSTHRTEELALASAWGVVRGAGSEEAWRLVIAPRHPPRIPEVEAALAREGFRTVRRTRLSEEDRPRPDAGTIVLVDTVGELGRFYHAADAVFVGGSLIRHGGQNPIEPAGLGKPVVFGPHMFNFEETAATLLEAGGAQKVASADGLAEALASLISDPSLRKRQGRAGRSAILARRGASRRTAALIRNVLAGRRPDE
jgi:3-deoxy-D-manno-octulosonic-acid transferase